MHAKGIQKEYKVRWAKPTHIDFCSKNTNKEILRNTIFCLIILKSYQLYIFNKSLLFQTGICYSGSRG